MADAARKFPAVSADEVTTDVTNRTDDVPVNMLGVQTCAVWGDQLSPGVWFRDKNLAQQNFDFQSDLLHTDWNDMYCLVAAGAPETLLYDLGCPVMDDMSYWERLEALGDDSYGYDDSVGGQPDYFDCDDPRDYEEWCDWNDAEAAEGYYHPDHLHEKGGFVSSTHFVKKVVIGIKMMTKVIENYILDNCLSKMAAADHFQAG